MKYVRSYQATLHSTHRTQHVRTILGFCNCAWRQSIAASRIEVLFQVNVVCFDAFNVGMGAFRSFRSCCFEVNRKSWRRRKCPISVFYTGLSSPKPWSTPPDIKIHSGVCLHTKCVNFPILTVLFSEVSYILTNTRTVISQRIGLCMCIATPAKDALLWLWLRI